MPHSKGWRSRRDRRTLEETPIADVLDGLLREHVFARGLPIGRLAAGFTDEILALLADAVHHRERTRGCRDERPDVVVTAHGPLERDRPVLEVAPGRR